MSTLSDTILTLKSLRANVGTSIYDAAVRAINRERLASGVSPEKRKRMPLGLKKKLYAKQNGRCARCEEPKEFGEMSDDHLIALAIGGTNNDSNRRLTCRRCNSEKGPASLIEESKRGYGTVKEQLETIPTL